MAHKRKDTLVKSPEWWKHLRPFNKRLVAKGERRAAKGEIKASDDDVEPSKGLHNDPKKMAWLRENGGEVQIPAGEYCYGEKGNCPFWDMDASKPNQENGFCWFLMEGDGGGSTYLLWDQCKCCSVREEWSPEGTIPVVDEKAE